MDPAFFTVRTPHPHTHQQHLHRMYEPPGMPAWTGMHACCCSSCYAHELMQHPWIGILCLCSTLHGRHPKKSFSKILEAVSRPEFAQDHESGLRSDRGPVVLCGFSKLRFRKSPYEFSNLYGRFCPYNPPHKPGKSISTPPFFSKMRTFFKNRLAWFHLELWYNWNHASRFLKNILIFFWKRPTIY